LQIGAVGLQHERAAVGVGHPRCVTRHRRFSDARQFYLKSIDKIAHRKLAPKHASRI
jgi:hypothetical protein